MNPCVHSDGARAYVALLLIFWLRSNSDKSRSRRTTANAGALRAAPGGVPTAVTGAILPATSRITGSARSVNKTSGVKPGYRRMASRMAALRWSITAQVVRHGRRVPAADDTILAPTDRTV